VNKPHILLCTVGTSLFKPNLAGLRQLLADNKVADGLRPVAGRLAESYARRDWPAVAQLLRELKPTERLCGAEINSLASLLERQYAAPGCGLFFFHSATADGRDIARILVDYYQGRGHAPVQAVEIEGLQDEDAKRFRTTGLRNLTRQLCKVIRDYSPAACAINATGGYKAQIAVGVLVGQALRVPVYYKHELFPEIISFPPMPVALDFEVWVRGSGLFFDLARHGDVNAGDYAEDWDERYESLVNRVEINGQVFLELSPVGQLFRETFAGRFRTLAPQLLPPAIPAKEKKDPRCDHGHVVGLADLKRFMERATREVPEVRQCATFYHNPNLPERRRFRLGRDGVEGIWSDGSECVKFRVETSAQTREQQSAVVAALNEWLESKG
jgi:putative CRISPR-associated protein (TIGR02619 family)